jgi:hypothetical protein
MPAEALFRSTDWALQINREFGAPIKTGCLNDLMDLSSVVKPLHAAGVPYFIGGPNTSRYIAPPLFYLEPPVGDEKVLVWLTPNLNGYGENFDFAMRPEPPTTEDALAEIESRLGNYLKSLETDGAPPKIVRDHFDFFGANWDYPYDVYLLPFYPAHAVDNGPQDLTASELARKWNGRWAYPRLIVSTPAEFFAEAEARCHDNIPTIRGELPGFWGEQIFFAMAQVDPEKEAGQRELERNATTYEMASALAVLQGEKYLDLSDRIARAYKLIALNNDHNPGPVPFGHTSYTGEDVAEWKQTRRDWIAEIRGISGEAREQAQVIISSDVIEPPASRASVSVSEREKSVVIENEFYRVEIDKESGGVLKLFDKELSKELASRDGPYLLNQYVAVARGENGGVRGNLFSRPGFRKAKLEIISKGPERATVQVFGKTARHPDAVKVLAGFIKEALGVPVPGFVIKAVTPLLGVKLGPVNEVIQEIELRAGEKAVYFTQRFRLSREQLIDHTFAYPVNAPGNRPLIVKGPYNPYRFSPGPPLGDGDLIPGARMTNTDFAGINDLTQPFGWIYAMPADAVFRSCVLAMGDGFGIAFSSKDSGVIFPGPVDKDPVAGPFGGCFYHLALGWTAYGKSFLGAPRKGEFTFQSALTSFSANDIAEAKMKAAHFSRIFADVAPPKNLFSSSNPAVLLSAIRPLNNSAFLLRLYESSGAVGEAAITLPAAHSITSACRARSDGLPISNGNLRTNGNSFSITLSPGEVATVRVEVGGAFIK